VPAGGETRRLEEAGEAEASLTPAVTRTVQSSSGNTGRDAARRRPRRLLALLHRPRAAAAGPPWWSPPCPPPTPPAAWPEWVTTFSPPSPARHSFGPAPKRTTRVLCSCTAP